ncbi:MAG: hypothetical protein QME75_02035 [Deltaproteobacteria bacterium]|nr:hypothetical protein [Deltaproteobacteria bacterium]
MPDNRSVCPIPYLGYCVYERCNFWDEEAKECTGLCFSDYSPADDQNRHWLDSPCTIYWTEDND